MQLQLLVPVHTGLGCWGAWRWVLPLLPADRSDVWTNVCRAFRSNHPILSRLVAIGGGNCRAVVNWSELHLGNLQITVRCKGGKGPERELVQKRGP